MGARVSYRERLRDALPERADISNALPAFYSSLLIFSLYICTLYLRSDSFNMRAGSENLEATYHVLWTLRALAESPTDAHFFLPTVTLDPVPGNDVVWGATVPTPGGSYIYTSFPPLGFLIPLFVLRLVGGTSDLTSLAVLNSLFGLIAAYGLAALTRCAALAAISEQPRLCGLRSRAATGWPVFVAAGASYLFLREAMHSHGAVYWPHSISQTVFIFASWLAFRHFIGVARDWERWPLLTFCAVFSLLEWTGYVFSFGLAAAFALESRRRGDPLLSGMQLSIVLVTVAAGLITLFHLMGAVGVDNTLLAFVRRAAARSVLHGWEPLTALKPLPKQYWLSVGALLPLGLAAWLVLVVPPRRRPSRPILLLLAITTFPLLENLLMAQHAVQFSFDRLKVAVPLTIALFTVIARLAPRWRLSAAAAAVVIVVMSNIPLFLHQQAAYKPWLEAVARNDVLVAQLRAENEAACAVYGSTHEVRGYLNLLIGRDMYEFMTPDKLLERMSRRGACGAILLETKDMFPGQPRVLAIHIYDENGMLRQTINSESRGRVQEF